jgi:hypothetical protein
MIRGKRLGFGWVSGLDDRFSVFVILFFSVSEGLFWGHGSQGHAMYYRYDCEREKVLG